MEMYVATGFRCPHTLGHVVYFPPEIIQIISCAVCSCVNVSFCVNSHCKMPHTQFGTVGKGGGEG